ncbi:hypothetical protein [Paracidovorax cattleyae]|nr:hypothetical protein [Paracidovorax cattleyae]
MNHQNRILALRRSLGLARTGLPRSASVFPARVTGGPRAIVFPE